MEILLLGFLIGMRHALDADHVSAVATLVAQRPGSLRDSVRQGVLWGLGHTFTLLFFALIVLLNGSAISERLASGLEWAVGIMLVWLGADLLRRLRAQRIHVHVHSHCDGKVHVHAHSHAHSHENTDESLNSHPSHDHQHCRGLQLRALLVGIMHGLAGSAALMLLVLGAEESLWAGLGYVLIFGVGTLVGMASLTLVIALPLRLSAQRFSGFYTRLQAGIAMVSMGLGGLVIYQQSSWLLS